MRRETLQCLTEHGIQPSAQRVAVADYVLYTTDHPSADQVWAEVKRSLPMLSRATVYNTLDILVDCDLVSKHQFGQNLAQYEKSYGYKQHDHLICTECHKVLEFCDPRGTVDHLDVRFLAVTHLDEAPVTSAESLDVRWWPVDALPTEEPDMVEMIGLALTR